MRVISKHIKRASESDNKIVEEVDLENTNSKDELIPV